MAFKGVTFAGQNVTPKDDGALYQAHYGDGILDGCSMAISGDDLVIQSGHFIAGGRVCHVDGATNVDLSGRGLTTGYIQVIMNYDLSQGEGSQWYTTFVESATTTFSALTQDDINGTGTLYQMELAVVQISGGNLTSIHSMMNYGGVFLNGMSALNSIVQGAGNPSLRLGVDGTLDGAVYVNNNTGFTAIASYDGSAYSTGARFYKNGTGTFLFSDGAGSIYLRPNGINSTTGQVYFNTSGQQIGGHSITTQTRNSDISYTANATTNVLSVTGLNSAGLYLIVGQLSVNPTSTSNAYLQCGIGTLNNDLGNFRETQFSNSTNVKRFNITAFYTGSAAYYLNFTAPVNCTISRDYTSLTVTQLA